MKSDGFSVNTSPHPFLTHPFLEHPFLDHHFLMDLEKRAAVPQSHDKHGTSSTQTPGNVTNKIKYLPNNVVTSGSGGGKSVKIKEGSYKGYGAGKLDRKDIFGTT